MIHLRIPVWSEQGWRGPEEVEARDLGGGRFVILCPPRLAYGLAVGDEIELVPGSATGFRVIHHSRNLTIWVYAATQDVVGVLAARARDVLERVAAVLEGTPPQMIIITVPLSSGWNEIAAVMNDLVASAPGSTWEYGNVYDFEDGVTPLNWWTLA